MNEVIERMKQVLSYLEKLSEEKANLGKNDQYQWEQYIRVCGKIEGVRLALYCMESLNQ